AGLLELPGGQPRALEERACLVDEHALQQAALPGGAERADGRAVAAGREAAGVAVRERAAARREEGGRVCRHAAAALDLFLVQRACTRRGRLLAHAVERPEQVDRGGPRRGERPLCL